MNLYAETSAVVAWLLDEERGDHARSQLAAADAIHQATALAVRNLPRDVHLLSFNDRIRANLAALGFGMAPASSRQS